MAVKITYFVHGATTDNEKGVNSGTNDVDLSELGIRQSNDLKELLRIMGRKYDVVFCSDLKRAVNSAKIVFGENLITDSRLRECNLGIHNGQPVDFIESLEQSYIFEKFPEGESYEDVRVRVGSFLKELKLNHDGKNIAIVAHRAPQLALNVELKQMSWEEAFKTDWRKVGRWQPGWEYELA